MSRRYQVHEFAALAGVTSKTLRHYDRLGLLQPMRTVAGYRVYCERDLGRLQQVVALKSLGLPLREIKRLLDRGTPVSEALLRQRTLLEAEREALDRAIRVIQDLEAVMASAERPDTAILERLMEVIAVQKHLQTMKKYYSDEAWEKLQQLRREHSNTQSSGSSESWRNLFREAASLVGEDPASDKAQAFCARFSELWQRTTGGDAGVLSGIRSAWTDRRNWPTEMQGLEAEFDSKEVMDFISKMLAASMKKYYSDQGWARYSGLKRPEIAQAWKSLYQEVRAALAEDPAGETGRNLARRWSELSDISTRGDPEILSGMKRAWEDRGNWPLPVRQHVEDSNLAEIVAWVGKAIHALHRESGDGSCGP